MTKKIGRNDQCPCGSGKKYKVCCGESALWVFEHPSFKDDKTIKALDEAEAKASFEAWFQGEKDAGRLLETSSFFEGTVYKDGTRIEWCFDHPAFPKLKTCEAATQVQAWEIFEAWWKVELEAARVSGKFSDGKIYRKTDMPQQAQRAAMCPNVPKHRDSKGNLLCVEHASTADGILVDTVIADAQNEQGFRCARAARLG